MKTLLLFVISINAFAFTPPADKTSLLPENNVVEITKKVSVVPNVDQYLVSNSIVKMDNFGNCTVQLTNPPVLGTCVYSFAAGTPLSTVETLCPANQAWAKLRAESLTAKEQLDPLQNQLALLWFMRNIYPLYKK